MHMDESGNQPHCSGPTRPEVLVSMCVRSMFINIVTPVSDREMSRGARVELAHGQNAFMSLIAESEMPRPCHCYTRCPAATAEMGGRAERQLCRQFVSDNSGNSLWKFKPLYELGGHYLTLLPQYRE